VGVWGTPLEVASRAADIITALPTAQLIQEQCKPGDLANICAKMLLVTQHACDLLAHKHVVSPHMSREKLQGRWGPVPPCGATTVAQTL
jgi:hypothetical protein